MSTSTYPDTIRASRERSAELKPKEHGAYAILGVPIVTALLIAEPTLPGMFISIAAITGFLAHEPLLVAWGHRGRRAQRTTPAAKKRLTFLIAITVAGGSLAFLLGDTSVRVALGACLLLAASSFIISANGKHRTLGGQIWGIVGLSAPCVPILIAGSQPLWQALEIWLLWLIGFASTTMAVRAVIAVQKRQPRTIHWAVITGLSVVSAALITLGTSFAVALLPMIIMSWYLMIQPPPAKQLRRVGWSLVAGTVATALWMVWLAST